MAVGKALIIGLDGASFNFIDPLVGRGKLPHIADLMTHGKSYYLTSTIPSNTPVAWTSMTTGQNPGKHGIFGFLRYDQSDIKVVSSRDNKALRLWDYLGFQGKSSIIINLPFTWPPQKIDGVMACFDWAVINDRSVLAEPASVNTYIKEQSLDKIATFHHEEEAPDLERYHDIVMKETQFTLDMATRFNWELLFVVFMVTDSVMHLYPTQKKVISEVYQLVDDAIGQLLPLIDFSTDQVFITSDHGTKVFNRAYPMPAFFKEQRLLHLKSSPRTIAQEGFFNLISPIRAYSSLKLPVTIRTIFKRITGRRTTQIRLRDIVDKEQSPIFLSDENSRIDVLIKINDRSLATDSNRKMLCQRIIDPINQKEKIIQHAWTSDEIYSGPHVDGAPDIILEMAENIAADIDSSSFYKKPQSYPSRKGGHIRQGILLAAGKSISPDPTRRTAHIADIAPTVLHMLQLSIPLHLDGQVLQQLFDHDSALGKPPKYVEMQTQKSVKPDAGSTAYTPDEEDQMKARLQKLGYL